MHPSCALGNSRLGPRTSSKEMKACNDKILFHMYYFVVCSGAAVVVVFNISNNFF